MNQSINSTQSGGQIKSGIIASYFSLFVSAVIALVFTPFLLRTLGQSAYGIYSLAFSIMTYFRLFNYVFSSPYMRLYSRAKAAGDDDAVGRLNGLFFLSLAVLGLLVAVLGVFTALNIDLFLSDALTMAELGTLRTLIILLLISTFLEFPFGLFHCYLMARERFLVVRSINIGVDIAITLVSAILLLSGYGSLGLIVVNVCVHVLSCLLRGWYCIRRLHMPLSFHDLDLFLLRETAPFVAFVFLNYIAQQFNAQVDKLLLGVFSGSIGIAIYTAGSTLSGYLAVLSSAVSSVFLPRVNRMVASGESDASLTRLLAKVGRFQWMAISLILSGFLFLGRPFIVFWAGAGYEDTYYIALLLMLPLSFSLLQDVGVEIQYAKNMHQFRSVLYFAIALVNVVVSIPLCRAYGGIGCAIGTAGATLIGNGLIMNIYYHKRVGLDMRYFWSRILSFSRALILPILFGAVLTCIVDLYQPGGFLFFGVTYTAVFMISAWLFGLEPGEKKLLRSFLPRHSAPKNQTP